jgi:hypothetical protein
MRRRFTVAVFICGLALGACSDASRQGPSETPAFDKGIPCPTTAFPLDQANALIAQLYPAGTSRKDNPQADMLAAAKDISQKWAKCKVADPQLKVVNFVNTLLTDFRNGDLVGGTSSATAALVSSLINTMYSGVGFGEPNLPVDPATGTDFGVGFFTPGQQLLVQTNVKDGAVLIPANAFTQTTAITVLLRPDAPNPFDGTGHTVLPPFFEITASNLSGTHYLANGQAVVGFCVDEATLTSLNQPAIAHLAVAEGSNPGGFEVLDDASAAQFASLGLDCGQYVPPVIGFNSLFGHGLQGFALAAPGFLRSAAASFFLPKRLDAALAKGGLGGLATSLSPFGVTDRNEALPANHLSITEDPGNAHYIVGGSLDTCHDGCDTEVRLLDGSNAAVGNGTNVTVSLVQTAGTGGVLSGTLTQSVGTSSYATFSDLRINQPGTYQLVFSAPGAASVTSTPFNVYALAFQTQPTATAGETVTPNDFLGETVSGFFWPVVQVKIVDFNGAIVTGLTDGISLSITGGALNGDTFIQASGGVASFTQLTDQSSSVTQNGLTVSTGGQLLTGLKLQASVFDEPPVLSATFNVDGRTF